MQWRVWKLKEKETREKFTDKVKELVNIEAKDLLVQLRMGFWRLVKNFVERNEGGSEEANGDRMKKCKKQ